MAELHDIMLDGIQVAEMEAGVTDYVTLDPKLVATLTEGDDNPQFPVLRVESGVSKNKFEWTPELMTNIAEQVNTIQPCGYLGHIKPEDDRYALPPVQTKWLKAVTKTEGDKTVLYIKGYNLPDEPIRRYNKLGVVNSASWKGKADVQFLKGGIQRVREFALESIDWSRKGKAAMSASLVTVAAEMEGKEETDVDGLGKVTVEELKTANPNIVTLIENGATTELRTQIAEMEEKVQVADEATTLFAELRKLLKIDEKADILEAVAAVQKKLDSIGAKNVRERVMDLLKSKIKDDNAREVVARLIPIAEMSEDLDDDGLTTKINEMIDSDESIKVIVNKFAGSGGPLKQKEIAEMEGGDDRYGSGKATSHVKVERTKV